MHSLFLLLFKYLFHFYVKHFELCTMVYEMCYINKQALPCLSCSVSLILLPYLQSTCFAFFFILTKCYIRHDILMSALWSNLHISIHAPSPKTSHRHIVLISLPLEWCRWSMAVSYTGPYGTCSESNRYSVWELSDRPEIGLIHL